MSYINAQGNEVKGESDLSNALLDDPNGATCTFCGGSNSFVDDCGFFYCWPYGTGGQNGPTCETCYDGEIGQKHIALYGLGER